MRTVHERIFPLLWPHQVKLGSHLVFLLTLFATGEGIAGQPFIEEISLPAPMPPEVRAIEVVSVEGHAPRVYIEGDGDVPTKSTVRPEGLTVDLLAFPAERRSFGDCVARTNWSNQRLNLTAKTMTGHPCGVVLPLEPQGRLLDALSYNYLHLRGISVGQLTVALADETTQKQEDNVSLATVSGPFDTWVSLTGPARRLDLRRLASIVLRLDTSDATVDIDVVALEHTLSARRTVPRAGFWVWDYQHAIAETKSLVMECQQYACGRISVQMPSDKDPLETWQAYVALLESVRAAGIEAFALDGYPEAIYTPTALAEKVKRLLTLLPNGRLDGVQLDIEPYLLQEFSDETDYARYLSSLEHVKNALGGRAPLSVVMPFWFTSKMVNGRPVAFSVMDLAQEVVIMSYRTTVHEVLTIGEDSLRYGDLAGIPVWLAVETGMLPAEQHLLLKREPNHQLADAYLDQSRTRLVLAPLPNESVDGFRVHHRTTVRPDHITLANQSRQQVLHLIQLLVTTAKNPSLAGVMIHDLHSFMGLRDTGSLDSLKGVAR